ncbi:MAG TPA: 4-hydroxy-tetrahydrodipicolinate reductase [Vicinamibacterales bacterium]|nr:4-hydroxy-tetrahydrodipicolinate reductase [Vicinamibacterales bacterium]
MEIGVLGCAGRMGRAVMAEILASADLRLVGGVEPEGHPALGQDLGALAGAEPLGAPASADAQGLIRRSQMVIEFSAPAATAMHALLAAECGTAHVIGTTGLDAAQAASVRQAASRTPILWAANMSLGVNLLLGLTEQVARALGPDDFDVEIVEIHHRHKVDAPSGTALALGAAVARGRGVELAIVAERGRDGLTGARRAGAIGFAALRGGDAVGDHSVVFAGAGERLELIHRASDRRIYARGALAAARWLHGRAPGLYGMAEVLGLEPRRG